jgi:predicted CopG family antitoxin
MGTKNLSSETDAYQLLMREKREPRESFSHVIRRVFSARHAATAGDLLDAIKECRPTP